MNFTEISDSIQLAVVKCKEEFKAARIVEKTDDVLAKLECLLYIRKQLEEVAFQAKALEDLKFYTVNNEWWCQHRSDYDDEVWAWGDNIIAAFFERISELK